MVPKALESKDFVQSKSDDKEEGKRSLLDERSTTSVREIANPSFLVRFLTSFGFIKDVMRNVKPVRLTGDLEEGSAHEKSPRLCDDRRDSMAQGEISRSTASCNIDECNESETDYGTFVEFSDLEPQENMAIQIKEIVHRSPDCTCIRISDSVALMIAKDIMEAAENEPCGLQGCRVLLSVDDRMSRVQLGEFKPKEGFLCTFEVNVVLQLKKNAMRFLIPFIACMPQGKVISDRYCITKVKLYTSRGSTPIHWYQN